ncbi:glycerophosphodiester phosphodiesterase family protein [Butyrivibrio sp. AE2032]|uniref:glycerophosphodiester phosphodiesterase family protein n=1 Tax=Butyrivibrio sp. AE2032 TaxID=1458463 RepID=UPI00055458E2|nr:glycerophosphodiester phosphodiesterase family protein [Butyrivibrio sp. AE2032]
MHVFVVVVIVFLCVLLILFGLYLFAIKPGADRTARMKPFEEKMIAHRGFFNNDSDAPENSLKAFKLAVENGYGIELDVQHTTDNKLVVFHDENLKRMCGVDKKLYECSYDELQQYHLANSDEKIPLFSDVLSIIKEDVPLIVEIKSEGDWKTTTEMTAEMMDKFHGIYVIESFHPSVVSWFRKNRPDVIRGQLSMDFFIQDVTQTWIEKLLLTNLMLNFRARPDFIAYDHHSVNQFSYRLCRKLFTVENVAWTIRSEEELQQAKKYFKCFIFDSFTPKS